MNIFKKSALYLKGAASYLVDPTGLTNKTTYGSGPNISWFGIGNDFGAYTDEKLLKEGFSSNASVYSIITAIASEVIDVKYPVTKNGDVLEGGFLYELIHEDPLENFSYKMEKAMINLLTTGDVFIRKVSGIGFSEPIRLEVLRSMSVDLILDSRDNVLSYQYRTGSKTITFQPEEIIHIKNYNPKEDFQGNHRGLSSLQAGYRALSASNNRNKAAAHLYENLGASAIVSDKNGSLNDDNEENQLQTSILKRLSGAHKAGQMVVTSAEIEIHQLGLSPKDLEITKSGPTYLRELASLYGVSSRVFNDPEGSTYNNSAVDDKNFFIKGVKKPLTKIIDALNIALEQSSDGEIITTDFSEVEALQIDQGLQIEKNKKVSESLIEVLTNEALEQSQKIYILVNVHGMDESEANKLVGNGQG